MIYNISFIFFCAMGILFPQEGQSKIKAALTETIPDISSVDYPDTMDSWRCKADNAMSLQPSKGSERDRDNQFHALLAGGARLKLLEAFLDLQIPQLLGRNKHLSALEICSILKLDLTRGWKFLHALHLSGLLIEQGGEHGEDSAVFSLSSIVKEYFGENGDEGYYFRDLVLFWRYLNEMNVSFVDMLRGAPLPQMPVWPPANLDSARHLELWMTVTAEGAIATLLSSKAMHGAKTVLDVGGGDGSLAIAMLEDSRRRGEKDLAVTVFNLPASAVIAKERLEMAHLQKEIAVVTGDFLRDPLPRAVVNGVQKGYDRVLFSRVLTDWTPEVCKMLFAKVKKSLAPGGQLVINEAFWEGNMDYVVSWEFRYIFYDTFGRVLFKSLDIYRLLLEESGFRIVSVSPMLDKAFYSVIVAEPIA